MIQVLLWYCLRHSSSERGVAFYTTRTRAIITCCCCCCCCTPQDENRRVFWWMNFIVIKTKSLLILLDSLAFPYSSFFAVRYNIIRPVTHTHTHTHRAIHQLHAAVLASVACPSLYSRDTQRSLSLSLSHLFSNSLSPFLSIVCVTVCVSGGKKNDQLNQLTPLSPSLPSSNSSSKLFLFYFWNLISTLSSVAAYWLLAWNDVPELHLKVVVVCNCCRSSESEPEPAVRT